MPHVSQAKMYACLGPAMLAILVNYHTDTCIDCTCCEPGKKAEQGAVCRVAKNSMSSEDCTDNIVAVVEGAVEHISKKWSNVQALHLKSVNSVALPVYQTLPTERSTKITISSK